MKLDKIYKPVQRSSSFQEQGFRVAANAQAFDILSSRLYTDEITAIIRELSTNAADAHRMAGREDQPFDVHLPNSMEPYFSIRDYGVSLTEDQIINVYTVYFESLNRQSDDTTGGFGLGSKSPFAYTDMFAVTAYKDGRKRSYSAFKENGEPRIALLTDESTTEPDGIEVRMDVQPGEVYEFARKAEKVYRFFDVQPNIRGQSIDIPNPDPYMEGDGWQLYSGDACAAGKISLVMGNVCYRVNRDNVTHHLGHRGELVLFVPVGTCQPAVSREELQYDDRTLSAIQDAVKAAEKQIFSQMNDSLQNADSILEKVIAHKQYSNIVDFGTASSKSLTTMRKDAWTLRRAEVNRDKLFIGYDRFASTLNPHAEAEYVFVELDVDDPSSLRQKLKNNLRHWIKQVNNNYRQAGKRNPIFYLATIEDGKRQLFNKVFGEPAIEITNIPDAPRANGGGGGGGFRSFIKKLGSGYHRRMNDAWTTVDKDNVDTTNAIAIPRKGYKILFNNREIDPTNVYNMATSLGYTMVYGIASNRYDKIRKELGLKDFESEAKATLEKQAKNANVFVRAATHHGIVNSLPSSFLASIKDLSIACKNLYLHSKADPISHYHQVMMQQFGIELKDAPNFEEEFKKAYPLLSSINLHYIDYDDAIEYINLKEKNND